jgi:hypothetical protein
MTIVLECDHNDTTKKKVIQYCYNILKELTTFVRLEVLKSTRTPTPHFCVLDYFQPTKRESHHSAILQGNEA